LQRREWKKTGGGKAPTSPSQVFKVVTHVIPASVNPLEQVFGDDAEEVPNLRCDKDIFKCEAGPCGLVDVEIIARKGSKVAKKAEIQK
jgi:hypothetical protein